ncbi:MAG: hypothetical protein Q9171_004729 [Xanthocarpia ochracea]
MAAVNNFRVLERATSLDPRPNPTSRNSFYSSSTGVELCGYGCGDRNISVNEAVLPTVARGPSFCCGWRRKVSWTRSSSSKGHFLYGSKAYTVWALVTVAICGLVATLIYLIFHFRGLIPKNDIQRILTTWETPGSPSEAQEWPASFSRGIVLIACHSHNDEERLVPLNGGFQTVVNGGAPPWEFALPVNAGSGQESSASLETGPDGNSYTSLKVQNPPSGGYGSTYITQPIPSLCKYVYYTLSFDAQTEVYGGQPGLECALEISLNGGHVILYNGPSGEILPFGYQRRSYTFVYSRNTGLQALKVRFECTAPSGSFIIDNISLVGKGET